MDTTEKGRQMKTVRILVVDDHEVVRRGIRTLLDAQRGWKVCGEAATGSEALKQAKTLNPDVIILDISMPGLDGVEATRRIRKAVPAAGVLILTMHETDELLQEALRAGANGYVAKSDAGDELVAGVKALMEGRTFLSVSALKSMMVRMAEEDEPVGKKSRSRLTRREHEVARLLGQGKTNKEIATDLNISTRTVETHRTNILQKLGFHSLSDLIRYTIREGMVQP